MHCLVTLHELPHSAVHTAGNNDRGQYLRIFESGGGYPSGGSSLMIPCGWVSMGMITHVIMGKLSTVACN